MKNKLYGAILGDLCGQPYEFKYKGDFSEFKMHNSESKFTDDTLMTLATAKSLIEDKTFEECYKEIGLKYQGDYYGAKFKEWLKSDKGCFGNSFGNGCLMRLSPIMYINDKTLSANLVVESCLCSHLNPVSIIASCKLFDLYQESGLRKHASKYKPDIKSFEKFEVSADKTIKFIESAYWITNSTHKTIEKVIKCGGDTDTNASIIGELMNYTFNDLNQKDIDYVRSKLDSYLLEILDKFNEKY